MGLCPACEQRDNIQILLNAYGVPHRVDKGTITFTMPETTLFKHLYNIISNAQWNKQSVKISSQKEDDSVVVIITIDSYEGAFDSNNPAYISHYKSVLQQNNTLKERAK